jgi:Asp-tRNA(Asn)/Glu-tRNA(Gln) amidotransferase A subunit family amidase
VTREAASEEPAHGSAELHRLTASEAAFRLEAGSISVADLARACLDRVLKRDPLVRAWAAVDRERVLAAAAALDGAPRRSPLHGIPIGIKDVIDVEGLPTEYNSPLYRGHYPAGDADCVAILREAGALIFGKTETVEFAAGGRPADRPAVRRQRSPTFTCPSPLGRNRPVRSSGRLPIAASMP